MLINVTTDNTDTVNIKWETYKMTLICRLFRLLFIYLALDTNTHGTTK